METWIVLFSVAVFAVCSTHAFVTSSRENVVAHSEGREIDPECLALADAGDCEFYSCFENRLPCGRDWFMLRQGHFYCNRVERNLDSFPEQAQNFLRDSTLCLMQRLKPLYRQDSVSCHDLEHQAVGNVSNCFVDNGFCTALQGEYGNFIEIFDVGDLFSPGAGKLWRELASMSLQCVSHGVGNLAATGSRALTNLVNEAADTISDHFETARDRIANLFDFKRK